jgi:hypothetical protein
VAEENGKNALIFIPDISGYTKFVNDTEIEHSQHIIEELIEVIIESNVLNLQVNEIEGDAVLFYRFGNPPTAHDIAEQSRKIFTEFHKYLKIIERDRVCHCGACSTASNLTLKIIVNYGNLRLSHIKGHQQLIGKSNIVAHRLMKNEIRENEYVLMSDDYYSKLQPGEAAAQFNWDQIQSGKGTYEHIGDVPFHFVLLTELHKTIPRIDQLTQPEKFPDPVVVENQIDAPIQFIYSVIIDLDERIKWTDGLKKIEFDREQLNRLGTKHICDVPGGKVELETILSDKSEKVITYAEKTTDSFFFPEATTFFILKEKDLGAIFRIEFHYKKRPVLGKIIDMIFRKKLANGLIESAKNLKILCESGYEKFGVAKPS